MTCALEGGPQLSLQCAQPHHFVYRNLFQATGILSFQTCHQNNGKDPMRQGTGRERA